MGEATEDTKEHLMRYELREQHIYALEEGQPVNIKGRLLHCPGCTRTTFKRGHIRGHESALECLSCGLIFQALSRIKESLASLTPAEVNALLEISTGACVPDSDLKGLFSKDLIRPTMDGWRLTDKGESYVEALDP